MASITYTSYYSNGAGRIRFILEVNTVETNITKNTTTERAKLYAYVDNASSGWFNLYGSPVSATINNSTRSENVAWDFRSTGEKILLNSWDTVVTHDSDGKKTINVSASHTTNVGLGSASINDTYVCDTIPRASSVSATSGYIGDTISIIVDKKATNFTQTITWKFGTLTGTIATKSSATTFTFTLPETFYNIIPNKKTGTGTIYCNTYDGNTQIGATQEAKFSVYTNEEICKPSVTINVTDANRRLETGYTTQELTGSVKKIINGYSGVEILSSVSSKKNSTLANYTIRCNDGNLKTSGNLNAETSKDLMAFFDNVSGSNFSSTIVDSRGYSNTATEILDLVEYDNIRTTTFTLERETQVSSTINLTLNGTYWNGNFGNQVNTIIAKYRYKLAGASDSEYSDYYDIAITKENENISYNGALKNGDNNVEFPYRNAYTFEIILLDKVHPYKSIFNVTKGIPVFSYGEEDLTAHFDLEVNRNLTKGGNKVLSITTLYDNSYGSNAEISLSDSVANYNAIEIYYKRYSSIESANDFDYTKIENANNRYASLGLIHYTDQSAALIQIYADKIYINGNKITRIGYQMVGIGTSISQWDNQLGGTLYITKVIGLK